MSHCHVAFEHLMKQVERYEQKKADRDNRPEWLCELIDEVADMFDPETELARVGFDCVWTGDRWTLSMFLGSVETVGGPTDGEISPVDFDFDVLGLMEKFEIVDRLAWQRPRKSQSAEVADSDQYRLLVSGTILGNAIDVTILAKPPSEFGPAMRSYTDGRLETV